MNSGHDESQPFIETHDSPDQRSIQFLPREGRLAGIDFGTIRIGIAVSDATQMIASPLEVYQRKNLEADAEYFNSIVGSERIVGFVIGLPVHMSGSESQKSREAVEFGSWLRKSTQIPVVWFDERFTTAMAREMLNQSSMSGKKRKAMLDKLAAQVLLSAYLDAPHKATVQGEIDDIDK